MNKKPTNDDALTAIANSSPDVGFRLAVWYGMGDPQALLDELSTKATQARFMGVPLTATDQFVYGCLKLASPELFVKGSDDAVQN